MRKVMYQLNGLSEPMPGFFHCWASDLQGTYAIIEDTNTGKLHRVTEDLFRFMQPPSVLKDNPKDYENMASLFDRDDLRESLCLIVSKVDSLAPMTERVHNISEALKSVIKRL